MSNIHFVTDPKDFVWTPYGMTPEQALNELPQVLLQSMNVQPCVKEIKMLEHLQRGYLQDNRLDLSVLAARCIVTARHIVSTQQDENPKEQI